jgi:hypothetical protein
MPTISWFFGIAIRMYFNDHAPPHFHAIHGDDEALVAIETGEVLQGRLGRNARRLVREWALRYNVQLMDNWARGQPGAREAMERIPGLDADDGD